MISLKRGSLPPRQDDSFVLNALRNIYEGRRRSNGYTRDHGDLSGCTSVRKKTTDEEIERLKGRDSADALLAGMVLASQVHDTALKTIAFVYGTTKGQVLEDMQHMGE